MSDLGKHIETVARYYLGEPNINLSNGSELRFGTNGSKSVDLDKGCWYDHENDVGGGVVDLVRHQEGIADGAPVGQILKEKFGIGSPNPLKANAALGTPKSYEYYDACGSLAYVVRRLEPKGFRQCQPDGNGGWVFNLDGVEPLPYGLGEITSRPAETIYVVEGEKCANALLEQGLLATTNSGGASNWKPALNDYFNNRDVVVLPDNDDAGRAHAHKIADQLFDTVHSIKILDLPGLGDKGDVVDWLAAGNKADELALLASKSAALADRSLIQASRSARDVFQTLSLDQIEALPEPKLLIDDMITENGFCIIYGAPGTGKSFVALDMGLSIAGAMPWQGKEVKQGDVLYIAGEGVSGLGRRIKAFMNYHALPAYPPLLVLPEAVNFSESNSIEKLLRTVDDLGGTFSAIFIDTLARALPGCDENNAADMGAFVAACDRVRHHTGAAVIGIHHSGKDSGRGMRGSSALLGGIDTSIEVSGSDGLVCVKVEKQKDHEPHPPIYLKMKEIDITNGSSIAMELVETGRSGKPPKRPKFGSSRNYAAYQALRNVLIDEGKSKVSVEKWHKSHASKSPDLRSGQRKDARQLLQDKGLVVIDAGMVWINQDVEEQMEPYSDGADSQILAQKVGVVGSPL